MFKKRKVLILFACLSFVFPIHSLAADKATTEVGIGFAEESSNSQEEPTTDSTTTDSKKEIPKTGDSATTDSTTTGDQQKVNNVSRTTRYGSASQSDKGFLPRTGEQQTSWLFYLGLGCVIVVFWIAVYSRVKKEGNHE